MMGHIKQIDPNEYQKNLYDEAYMRREYRKALPWINIMIMDLEKVPLDEHERL